MNKDVRLKNERIVRVFDDENILNPHKQITESFTVDGLQCAHYSLVNGDIYSFNASLDIDLDMEENKNKLVFEIEVDHPLYFPLLHLLDGNKELIIHDDRDDSEKKDMKYLSVKNDNDLITLNFIDKNRNENLNDRFVILCDKKYDYLRNRISAKNNELKKRINDFFDEACSTLLEDYHQISFEEYSLKKTIDEREKIIS